MPHTHWEPSPLDATSFAAFRWFANAIENDSLALYATNRETFEHIEGVLRNTLKELAALQQRNVIPPPTIGQPHGDGCPNGWILCNGVCMPSCD